MPTAASAAQTAPQVPERLRTQQAKEYICFSLKRLNAISIYIQMTAIQRERQFGWELGVLCITTLFGVSVYLCYARPVKIPVEVNNEGIFWTAIKTPLASQANAVSLLRAQAAKVLRLQQTAPGESGEDGDIFSLKLQT